MWGLVDRQLVVGSYLEIIFLTIKAEYFSFELLWPAMLISFWGRISFFFAFNSDSDFKQFYVISALVKYLLFRSKKWQCLLDDSATDD